MSVFVGVVATTQPHFQYTLFESVVNAHKSFRGLLKFFWDAITLCVPGDDALILHVIRGSRDLGDLLSD